jgi:hypothetical protein
MTHAANSISHTHHTSMSCRLPLQPLFIQAPLQAMLEAMLDKLQVQAAAISGLQDKVNTQQLDAESPALAMKQLLGPPTTTVPAFSMKACSILQSRTRCRLAFAASSRAEQPSLLLWQHSITMHSTCPAGVHA